MGQITTDQSHQVLATLITNTDWITIDFAGSGLQDSVIRNPQEAGRQFTAFLRNGGKMMIGDPRIIPIDRSKSFDPTFIGEGWKVIEDETDTHSAALTQVDLSNVLLVTMLQTGESYTTGEERLKRLKPYYLRLDARVFKTLWENQFLIPGAWKQKVNGNIQFIRFDGTVLQSAYGHRCVLCLYWRGDAWDWNVRWLAHSLNANDLSAVLGK